MEEIDQSADLSGDESAVIKALRAQIKDKDKELATRPPREELESEIRNQLKRESDIAALLTKQGHPTGLAEFALSKIGDQDVTEESVVGFLQGIGFDTNPVSAEEVETASPNQQLATVTDLARRVSAAASNAPADLSDRIARTTNRAELDALMAETGLLQS